ncbi:MAG TPA: FAD-dependent oxidoreductase [Ignavibacteria bacterium]
MSEKIIYLKDRRLINEFSLAMWFDYKDSGFTFEPGQYARITLLEPIHHDAEGNSRIFSIASSPWNKETIMFTTRALDSAFNKNIQELPIGSKVSISEPGGNTVLHKDPAVPAVFIIGGIGITPVRCMVEYATESKLPYDMHLFYSNPAANTMAFFDDFLKWEKENPNFKFHPTIDDTSDKNWKYDFGYISEDMLKKHIKDFSKPVYYLVGPQVMVDAINDLLIKSGVKHENIKLERFG